MRPPHTSAEAPVAIEFGPELLVRVFAMVGDGLVRHRVTLPFGLAATGRAGALCPEVTTVLPHGLPHTGTRSP